MMIEQPLDYDDLVQHAHLQKRLRTPICLDESIHSPQAASDALDLGACRIINIKPGRLGGFAAVARGARPRAAAGDPALAWRHARKRHRPGAQPAFVDAAGLHAAGRCRGQPPLFRARI